MAFFRPTEHQVEAFQWLGDYGALPFHVAIKVELQGQRAPLVHVGDGTKIPLPEGSWLVIGPEGLPCVLTEAAFERRYQPQIVVEPKVRTLRLSSKEKEPAL